MANPNLFPPFWRKFTDKVLHFCFGGAIYFFFGFGLYRFVLWLASLQHFPQVLGLIFVVIGAFGKEFYDMTKTRTSAAFDWWDILATICGGVAALIGFAILQRI
jgi:hypothetical protein